ncbi:hypothetical protein [Motiliproteus sediminis]|uniref:hypothetical protein n=1 Tax=Motiliproteus sediminis TaxID=1468178 RepID=UPI001AEF433E|nr:hypothetical protein [Motiliproteus sediminis]
MSSRVDSHGGNRQWIILGVCALLVLLAAQLGYRWIEGRAATLSAAADCDLTQGCQAGSGRQQVRLHFDRAPASHQRFIATAELSGLSADSVVLDLQGAEMFMGVNRYPLHRDASGRYRGEVQLPACTSGRMQWNARVVLGTGSTQQVATFTFWAK